MLCTDNSSRCNTWNEEPQVIPHVAFRGICCPRPPELPRPHTGGTVPTDSATAQYATCNNDIQKSEKALGSPLLGGLEADILLSCPLYRIYLSYKVCLMYIPTMVPPRQHHTNIQNTQSTPLDRQITTHTIHPTRRQHRQRNKPPPAYFEWETHQL